VIDGYAAHQGGPTPEAQCRRRGIREGSAGKVSCVSRRAVVWDDTHEKLIDPKAHAHDGCDSPRRGGIYGLEVQRACLHHIRKVSADIARDRGRNVE
jgi:hypothetical protein